MSDWSDITWSKRIAAGGLVVLGVGGAALSRTPASGLMMCAALLYAWDLAFIPSPPWSATLREVYRESRQGRWKTPQAQKLVVTLATLLFAAGIWLQVR